MARRECPVVPHDPDVGLCVPAALGRFEVLGERELIVAPGLSGDDPERGPVRRVERRGVGEGERLFHAALGSVMLEVAVHVKRPRPVRLRVDRQIEAVGPRPSRRRRRSGNRASIALRARPPPEARAARRPARRERKRRPRPARRTRSSVSALRKGGRAWPGSIAARTFPCGPTSGSPARGLARPRRPERGCRRSRPESAGRSGAARKAPQATVRAAYRRPPERRRPAAGRAPRG